MGWRFGFAKVAAQVSTFVEDFCKRIRAHFSIFVSLSQKVRHLRPSMLRLHRFLVPLFPRTQNTTLSSRPYLETISAGVSSHSTEREHWRRKYALGAIV